MENGTDRTLRIDTWLMSCRVIGRTVEQFFFNVLLQRARKSGYKALLGEFLPTKKNSLVADLYDRLGFRRSSEAPDGALQYHLSVPQAELAETFVLTSD
jgi:predicted enzyme involved in methoxymalonyl-ACP biosynthesis